MNIDETYLDYYAGEKSDHFDGTRFFNPWNPNGKKGFLDLLKWKFNGNRAEWPEKVENAGRPPIVPSSEDLRVTYIGHATFLVQAGGMGLLIDPVFSDRASPFSAIGPKRVRKPFIGWSQLPKIDYVFISHNHYDHLDQPSIGWLARNHKPVFITPLGNTRLIKPCVEYCSMIALDWHQSTSIGNGMTLSLTPAQHWSRRGINDINRDLWGGLFLKTKTGTGLYYSADTGFDKGLFQSIRDRNGIPDLALLPIGAYEPRWFMKYSHMNPDDTLQAYKILGARAGMAFHHETFHLSDEAFDMPRRHTLAVLERYGIAEKDFLVPVPGDFRVVAA